MMTRLYVAVGAILLPILVAVRMPRLIMEPRFWAEEARDYFEPLRHKDFVGAFFHVGLDNYQFALNMTAAAAARVPLEWAPSLTTFSALLVVVAFGALLGLFAADQAIRPLVFGLLLANVALVPSGYEVYLTMTNAQWVLGASLIVVLCLSADRAPATTILVIVWAAFCGLSGVPSVVLAPLFLFVGLRLRSQLHLGVGAALCAAALLHLVVIFTGGTSRSLDLDLLTLTMPTLLQAVAAPVIGIPITRSLSELASTHGFVFIEIAMGAGLLVASLTWVAARRFGIMRAALIVMAIGLTGLVLTAAALGGSGALMLPADGGRYFFATTVGFLLLCSLAATSTRLIPAALLVWMLAIGVWHHSLLSPRFGDGPSWAEGIAACQRHLPCEVPIWPEFVGPVLLLPN